MSLRVATLLCVALIAGVSWAQVIQAQHGTLVLQNGRANLVLSVPVSAFSGWDNDGNRILSPSEFATHRNAFVADIGRKLRLRDESGSQRLQDITVRAAAPDHAPPQSMTQLLINGHFELEDMPKSLRLTVDLYGITDDEKQLHIAVSEPGGDNQIQLVLTPDTRTAVVLQERD